jgi:hypothetical protein
LRDLADGGDVLFEVHVALFGDERRVGGDAVDESHLLSVANLLEARGVEEEFHL